MQKQNKKILYGVITVAVAVLLILLVRDKPNSGNHDEFAQYLTANGAVMYGTEWCSHCKAQKELFGDSFVYVNYVDCDREAAKCDAAGVKGYPTWIINNQSYPGAQPLERLAQLTGYQGNITD